MKILLFVIEFVVFTNPDVPEEKIALTGRFDDSFVIRQLSIVLPEFPVPEDAVAKYTIPPDAAVDEPFRIQYFIISCCAVLINLIVDVPAVFAELEFDIIRSGVDPVSVYPPVKYYIISSVKVNQRTSQISGNANTCLGREYI